MLFGFAPLIMCARWGGDLVFNFVSMCDIQHINFSCFRGVLEKIGMHVEKLVIT